MGYIVDTGNNDVRTEGMSYGMMMAVQMNRKDIFDRLWLFSKTYMHQSEGKFQGYFAWSVSISGVKNSEGPAPDGEEYFAMALFLQVKDGEMARYRLIIVFKREIYCTIVYIKLN